MSYFYNNCIMLNMLSDSALLQISSEFVFRLKVVFEGCFSLLIFCCSKQAVILLFTKWHIITFKTFSSTLNFLAVFGNLVTILIQLISERFINSDFILFFLHCFICLEYESYNPVKCCQFKIEIIVFQISF